MHNWCLTYNSSIIFFIFSKKWSVVIAINGWLVVDSCINVFMAFGVLLGTIFFCYRNIEFRVVIYVNLYFLWPLIRKILFIIAVISWISFYLIGYSIFYGFLLSSFLLIGVMVIFQRMSGSLHLFLRSERYPVSIIDFILSLYTFAYLWWGLMIELRLVTNFYQHDLHLYLLK